MLVFPESMIYIMWVHVPLIGEQVLVNSRWRIVLYDIWFKMYSKPRKFYMSFQSILNTGLFLFILSRLLHLNIVLHIRTLTFACMYNQMMCLNVILFQPQILKNHSLVLTWYAIIQTLFNLETCSPV